MEPWNSDQLAASLYNATARGSNSEVLGLLQRGVDPNSDWCKKWNGGRTPLMVACSSHPLPLAEYLIKWGARLDITEKGTNKTALHWACGNNNIDCVKVLMDHSSPTDLRDNHNRTAMDLAKERKHRNIVEFINSYKPQQKDPLSSYPSIKQLSWLKVIHWHELGTYLKLSENELKVAKQSKHHTTVILLAAKVKNMDLQWKHIAEALLHIEEYELAESICHEQDGPNSWVNFIKYVIETVGINPTEPLNKSSSKSLLSLACTRGHIGVIDYLVMVKGYDPYGPVNAAGDTLQSIADAHKQFEVLKYLENFSKHANPRYLQKLDELMRDESNTIELHYLKMYFIGSSGIGKSTTRKRLTGTIMNITSLPEEQRKRCSTNLAEFSQVLAMMDPEGSKLTLKVSANSIEEMRDLFAYVYSSTVTTDSANQPSITGSDSPDPTPSTNLTAESNIAVLETTNQPISQMEKTKQMLVAATNVDQVIARFRSIVGSGKYAEQLKNKILLNLVDVGGQPGFLEMFPFLSKGPGIFLAFFQLDKHLDELCEISYESKGDKITPYPAIYTNRETLSQILSSISHHVTLDSILDQKHLKKLGELVNTQPVATLVGTFKDKLKTMVMTEILREKLSAEFPEALENEKEKAIQHILTTPDVLKSIWHEPAIQTSTVMQNRCSHILTSESFNKEVNYRLTKELSKKNEAISSITCNFEGILVHPANGQAFISIDNFTGKEDDIDPLREHLQAIFESFFKAGQLRIRPSQLLLGVILRKEYNIVCMDDCIHIGRALNMTEEEVKFSLWYLDRYVGAVIYHPEIDDDWFKNNIICNPQVVFNSISSIIIEPLLMIHCPGDISRRLKFTDLERRNWLKKGQFSLDTLSRCLSEKNEGKIKQGELIPVSKLAKFLEHSNLLSHIRLKRGQKTEILCFIPAILECASPEELTKPPPPDADTPSPIKLTFENGYVPIGMFCALISRLVTEGYAREGILGMRWELVETEVKRNFISFQVDHKKHNVTLISHVDCYEIRILRQNRSITLNDLCSYVLSTILYVLNEINNNVDPIIGFDCLCGQHQLNSIDKLCLLSTGVTVCFSCTHSDLVTLSSYQESWFAKEVKSTNESTIVKALPFLKRPMNKCLIFEWTRNGSVVGTGNTLKIDCTPDDYEGYYTCEILKDNKPYFNVYKCLRIANYELSGDALLNELKQVTEDVRSDWYSLAIELEIDYGTRKAIERNHRFIDWCFHALLSHWVKKTSPPLTWSGLVKALGSLVIDRRDIAEKIIQTKKETGNLIINNDNIPFLLIDPQGTLSVNKHLKVMRQFTWEVRANWYHLGVELGINVGTLKVIKHDQDDCDLCYTSLLEHWLTQTEPYPKLSDFITALKSSTIDRADIARKVEDITKEIA